MGLSVSLSNALSGLNASQQGLEVVSRNVSNSGSPGYHRQSVVVTDGVGTSSNYVRFAGVHRAFEAAIERQHSTELSGLGYADVQAEFLARLETALGKPGSASSLDTIYLEFEKSMETLTTSPDDYATRAVAITNSQALAEALNRLTGTVQDLRQETEGQLASSIEDLNQSLSTLESINNRLSDYTVDAESRATMLDERDRLVGKVSDLIDTQVRYNDDGSVVLMTKSGLGLLDKTATRFEFTSVGQLSASSLHFIDDSKNGVGKITAFTPSGLTVDVVDQKIIQSGRISGLVDLRDKTLVQAQAQLDEIAATLAQTLNGVETPGTPVVSGAAAGFDVDATNIQKGNSLQFSYTQGGVTKNVNVIRVDDNTKLPMDYIGPNGERVLGLNFTAGIAAVAAALDAALGAGLTVSNPADSTIRILDDGATGATDVLSASTTTTVTAGRDAGLGLSLFVDSGNKNFTNSLDGITQKLGFAGRISVNSDVLADNKLLVQYATGGSLGDSARATYLVDRLEHKSFTGDRNQVGALGNIQLSGSIHGIITQVLNFQGSQISAVNNNLSTRQISLEAVESRIEADYGVDINEEMARLIELQNAFSANARVISIAQELMQALMQI